MTLTSLVARTAGRLSRWVDKLFRPYAKEHAIIARYAISNEGRDKAILAHRALLSIHGYKDSIYYGFMHEVDNAVPDYALRAHYRARLKPVR